MAVPHTSQVVLRLARWSAYLPALRQAPEQYRCAADSGEKSPPPRAQPPSVLGAAGGLLARAISKHVLEQYLGVRNRSSLVRTLNVPPQRAQANSLRGALM